MSAFIVSHDHIDALLSFAMQRDTYGPVSYYVKATQRRVDITTETLAHTIINAIRHRAIGRLPGYENADGWEFDRSRALLRKAG